MPQSTAMDVLVIVTYALAGHALILLNDGLYWDGWIVDSWQRNRSWAAMKRFYAEVGLAPLYYQHRWLGGLPAKLFAYRVVAFGSLLASAIAVYALLRHTGAVSQTGALLIALLYLSYTGYHMNLDTVVAVNYTFPTAVFYSAALVALLALDHDGMAHWSLRLASLALFVVAFNANSTLVYYFGFLALRAWMGLAPGESWPHELASMADYLVLPFAFWFLKNHLTPRHGDYADYNRLRLTSRRFPLALLQALRFGFEASLTAPWRSAAAGHYLWLAPAAFFGALAIVTGAGGFAPIGAESARNLLLAGCALFVLAAVPYALVGQSFYPHGWGTKNHMLFHLPVGLIVFGALNLALPPDIAVAAIAVILVLNAIHLNLTHLHYLAAWAKNLSWLRKLARLPDATATSVFLIDDRHSVRADLAVPEQEHRAAYLFYMLEWAWNSPTRCGISLAEPFRRLSAEEVERELASTTLADAMTQVDRRGGQAGVTISDGVRRSPTALGLLYLRERYLPGGRLDRLLETATEVRFIPLPS